MPLSGLMSTPITWEAPRSLAPCATFFKRSYNNDGRCSLDKGRTGSYLKHLQKDQQFQDRILLHLILWIRQPHSKLHLDLCNLIAQGRQQWELTVPWPTWFHVLLGKICYLLLLRNWEYIFSLEAPLGWLWQRIPSAPLCTRWNSKRHSNDIRDCL